VNDNELLFLRAKLLDVVPEPREPDVPNDRIDSMLLTEEAVLSTSRNILALHVRAPTLPHLVARDQGRSFLRFAQFLSSTEHYTMKRQLWPVSRETVILSFR